MKNWLGNTPWRIAHNNGETAVDGWNPTYIFADHVFPRSSFVRQFRLRSFTVYVNYHYLIAIIIIIIVVIIIIVIVTYISKVIDCGVLPTPVKASKILETHTRVDGMVRFKCTEKGYQISGSEMRKCLNTGLWSGTITKCTSKLGS